MVYCVYKQFPRPKLLCTLIALENFNATLFALLTILQLNFETPCKVNVSFCLQNGKNYAIFVAKKLVWNSKRKSPLIKN